MMSMKNSDNAIGNRAVPPRPLLQMKSRLRLKCGGTGAEIRFRLSAKRTSPFKLAGASVYSTTGSQIVHNSGSIARSEPGGTR
jgi:hypothetical protein